MNYETIQANPIELRATEEQAARSCENWFQAYLNFPTVKNLDGLLCSLHEYQTAWMHGRAPKHD